MSPQHKSSNKTATTWQRHALAQACFMVASGISTSAWALPPPTDFTPGAALSSTNATLGAGGTTGDVTNSSGDYWSTGYNAQIRNYQLGSGQINGIMDTNSVFSIATGAGSMPISLNANNLMLYSYGNQNSNANLALNTLTRVNDNNDGQLALNLQIFSGLATNGTVSPAVADSFTQQSVLATAEDTSLYITQTGKNAGALSLSSNNVGATLSLNTVSTSVTGATPSAYVSATQGTSSVAYGDNNSTGSIDATAPNSTRGTTGSVNLSNLQSAFNAEGTAQLDTPRISITVAETVGNLSSGISINANTLTTNNTSNEANSVVVATSGSSAFTGSVAVTNIQATKVDGSVTATQLANVKDSTIFADLRDTGADEAKVSGTVSVNANTVSAKAQGNTAGARTSTGSISVGNAIVFEGSSDITGSTAPKALTSDTGVQSAITTTTTLVKADLLINSVQRNAGNEFTSTVDSSTITTQADNLAGGSLAQNNNTQTATATANLAGSLIDAGNTGSVGNIKANAAVINTQVNSAVAALAEVSDATQQVTVGSLVASAPAISGSVSLNDNSILATAEGNVAASQLRLKANTLTVGGNGTALVDLNPTAAAVASSGLAASVLSVQANDTLTLTSSNNGNTVAARFNDQDFVPADLAVTGSQVSVNNNTIASTAIANAASNTNNLVSTNAPGLNAGLGNSQSNTDSLVTAQADYGSDVSVAITAANVTNSSLSLNTNAVNATAKGNSASNNLSVQATNASGLAVTTGGLFDVRTPYSSADDAGDSAKGVQASADFALANAQLNYGGTLGSVVLGQVGIATATANNSTVSVNSNSLASNTSVNSAGNALGLTITNMTGMSAGLSSAQSAASGTVSAETTAGALIAIGEGSGAISAASGLSLNSNTISSAVSANTVQNTLSLTATTASGRDLTQDANGNYASASLTSDGRAYVDSDLALANQQKISSGTFTATTTAETGVTGGAIDDSSVTVNSNTSSASVSANRGTNSMALAVNNLSKPNSGLASSQLSSSATFTAQLDAGTGFIGSNADNAQIAVTNNQAKASVLGNVVSNALSLSGSQATGSATPMYDNTTSVDGLVGTSITSASAGLANLQSSTADTFSANLGGVASTPNIVLTAVDASGASTLSLNSNTLATSVYANDASNTLGLSVTQMSQMTAALASGQAITALDATASTVGRVALTANDVTALSTATANSNTISATLSANTVSNTLQVRANQFTGQNTLVPALGATNVYSSSLDRNATSDTDLSLVNVQSLNASVAATATATGDVLMTFNSLSQASASTNSNAVTAYASGNSANNLNDVQVTGFNTASLGLASAQFAYAPISATTAGQVIVQGTDLDSTANASNLSVNSNAIRSTAAGNIVDNTLVLKASNASGADVAFTGGVSTMISGDTLSYAVADWGVVNNQLAVDALVQARTGTSIKDAVVKLVLDGDVVADVNGPSALSLSSNALSASAFGNSANNTATVVVTNATGMTGAVASTQTGTNGGGLEAKTYSAVQASIEDISGSSLAVNSNAIAATAKSNTVVNTLSLSGASASGRTQDPSIAWSMVNGVLADYSLINQQSVQNSAEPIAYNASDIGITSGNVINSTVSQNSNSISAYASGNDAINRMTLAVTELSAATAGLASSQLGTSASAVNAEVLGTVSNLGGDASGSSLSLNSNQIKSNTYTNLAVNQINVSGSGAQSGASVLNTPALNLTSTSADVSLVNAQLAANNVGGNAATTGTVEMALGSIASNSNVSVNNNQITAQGYLSSATNGVALNVTNLTAMNANVLNTQTGTGGATLTVESTGDVEINATDAVSDAILSMNSNAVSASAYRNTAENTLTVQATNASGRGVGSRQSLASSALAIQADYALGNFQEGTNGSSVTAGTVANVVLFADNNTADDSQMTVQANSLTAYGSGNSATNQMTLAMNQLTQASAAVSSYQSGTNGASTLADFDGWVKLTVGDVDTVALSMKDNSIKATAIGNVVGNKLDVMSNTATGTGTGSVAAGTTGSSATVNADFAVTNVQALSSSTTANTDGSINVATGAVTDSSLGLTGNSIASLAVGNSAGNTLLLNVAQQSGLAAGTSNGLTAAVSSSQTSTGTVSATTSPKDSSLFGIETFGVTDSTITLSGNTASAVASKNEAFNTLTVSGANVFGRGSAVSSSVAGTSSVTGADFAVINAQSASNATTATMDTGTSGLTSTGALSGSTVTLSNNSVLANASANTTGNSLNLLASNKLEASGVVNNVQSLAASAMVISSVTAGSALSVETGSGAGSGNVAVTGNQVKSTASANVATNALNATSSNGMADAGAVSSPSGSNTANPTFAVLNSQSTGSGSTVSSVVYGFNMGGQQLSGALNGGSASVTGNVVQSMAYGNSASNAIQVSAMAPGLNTASTSITNVQYNLASVTARVENVNMQASGTSVGAGNVNLGGNSIVAMAVGNRAVNTVTGR